MEKVKQYYAEFDEWRRLDTPEGRLEFVRTMKYLEACLKPNSRVLDLGGGPGRYSIALAQQGHRVCLSDLSPEQLSAARVKIDEARVGDRIESILEVNASDLSAYASSSFDAVVALGPFYHLIKKDDRTRAADEMARVLRVGGLVFVSFIPRVVALSGLIVRASVSPDQISKETFAEVFREGVFRNPSPQGFQEGYHADPHEMRELLVSAGFRCEMTVSLRGIASGCEAALWALEEASPDLFDAAMEALDRSSSLPEVVACRGHALIIAAKAVET